MPRDLRGLGPVHKSRSAHRSLEIDKKWQRQRPRFYHKRLTDPFTPRMHAAACRSPQMRVSLTDQAPQLPLVTAPSMGNNRLIAIGDVHGCFHAARRRAPINRTDPGRSNRFPGRTWSTPGKETREVLERIIALKQECNVVLIRGNHEKMMYAARENEKALRYWENCGGIQTLNSYRFGGTLAEIPAEHWALLDTCVPYYETDEVIFTHANYMPDLPMVEQRSTRYAGTCSTRQTAAPLFR